MQDAGRFIIILAVVLFIVGVIVYTGLAPRIFGWMGNLPGDIRIDNGDTRLFIPITTSIVISIILTIIVRIVLMFRGA